MTVKLCLHAVPAIIPSLDDFLAGNIYCIVHACQCLQCCRTSSFLLLSLAVMGAIGLFTARSSTVIHEERVSWRQVMDIRFIEYVFWVRLAEARVDFCVAESPHCRGKEHIERCYMSDQEESRGIEDLAMAQHNIELNMGCGPCNPVSESGDYAHLPQNWKKIQERAVRIQLMKT